MTFQNSIEPGRPWATRGRRKLKGSEYYYDAYAADRPIRWIATYCRHTIGELAGQPFYLARWQRRWIRKAFGWKNANGTRRFRTVFIAVPRKNGKSTLAAAVGLYLLMADGEPGAQIFSIAGNAEQAQVVFGEASRMIVRNQALNSAAHCLKDLIDYAPTVSVFRCLSGRASTKHGFNPHGVIGDEVHAWRDREAYDVMTSATGARRQPMEIYITTAGYDTKSICWDLWRTARQVASGDIDLPSFLPVLYAADPSDDWTAEATWRKANPGYGISIKPEYLKQEFQKAKVSPLEENRFRRLHLNQWTEQATRWISMDTWRPLEQDFDEDDLIGARCFAGLDLAQVHDISSQCLLFPPPTKVSPDKIVALWRHWAPEHDIEIRQRRDRVPYQLWRDQGWLRSTPGEATDYRFIERDIIADLEKFTIEDYGFDPMYGHDLMQRIVMDHGLQATQVRQGMYTLAQPTAEWQRLILKRDLIHNGDPILDWMIGNVAVDQDHAGNIKPSKSKSREKIDGVAAAVTALARLMDLEREDYLPPSPYENENFRIANQ